MIDKICAENICRGEGTCSNWDEKGWGQEIRKRERKGGVETEEENWERKGGAEKEEEKRRQKGRQRCNRRYDTQDDPPRAEGFGDVPSPGEGAGLPAMFLRWNVMGSVATNNRAPIV